MSHNHMSLDGEDRLEFLVPPKTTIANQLAATGQRFSRSERQPANDAHSLAVDRPKRTAATWGITGPELNRLANAVRLMELHCEHCEHCQRSRVDLWLATTARATPRDVIADIWKRVTRLQGTTELGSTASSRSRRAAASMPTSCFSVRATLRNVSNSRDDLAKPLIFVPSLTRMD